MKKLLVLGSNTGCFQLIEEAHRRGIHTIAAGPISSKRQMSSLGADEIWDIDTSAIEELEKKCREQGVDAVINGISAFNTEACMELARRLNLPFYATPESWHYTVNKYDFKALCRKTGVPVAKDYFVNNPPTDAELNQIQFPVVVKAIDLGANRGMSYCYKKEDIEPACNYARSLSKSDLVVIEKMLQGTEYAAHYAVAEGEASLINFCCMLSQPGYPGNCYSVTSTETDQYENYMKELHPHLLDFIRAAGIREGVCWFEMMLDTDGHLYVLEMGYRMSGDLFAIPMNSVCGFDSYQWLVDIAMGIRHLREDLPKPMTELPERCGTSYIIWSKNYQGKITRLSGLEEVARLPGVTVDCVLREGSEVNPYQYLVIIPIDSPDSESLIQTIEQINKLVEIEGEQGENIAIFYDDFDRIRSISR